jgi:hypothetical protein
MIQCLKWHQTNPGSTPVDVICRSLLIIAYGIYELPTDGLALAANAHKIDLQHEVQEIFVNLITDKQIDSEVFDIAIEGLAHIWLKMPEMLQDLLD